MGVKVSKVYDRISNKEITVKDCDNGYDGDYICITDGCNARMSFVRTHEQRRHEKVIVVRSFFKLKSNENHSYHLCPFNTKGAVEVIVRDSDPNIMKALSNEKYEFSLQVLHKPDQHGTKSSNGIASAINSSRDLKQKKYTRKGTASNYIKALSQILTLRSKLEQNEELASLILLNYRGKKIKWDTFYFEQNFYQKAFELFITGKSSYPICFHGVVSRLIESTDKFKYQKIKLHSPHVELKQEINLVPSVELIISDKKTNLGSYEGQEILAYGIVSFKAATADWIPDDQKELENPKTIRFQNISMWINHGDQVIII